MKRHLPLPTLRQRFASAVPPRAKTWTLRLSLLACIAAWPACGPKAGTSAPKPETREEGALCRVGSVVVYDSDLTRELAERRAGAGDEAARKKALEDLAGRAQMAQAALEANLERDPEVRAQFARALGARLKEQALVPQLKALGAPVPEPRLRELYLAATDRFRSPEKRQIAVLWLDAHGDPTRTRAYEEKLASAREWYSQNTELQAHAEQGFSALGVDHSEHAASRFKGGIVGWMERAGGADAWNKAVAEIGFALENPGDVSGVTTRKEGVFLVRYMAQQPAILRPFETVSGELDRLERQRLRAAAEAEFDAALKAKHPVQWRAP